MEIPYFYATLLGGAVGILSTFFWGHVTGIKAKNKLPRIVKAEKMCQSLHQWVKHELQGDKNFTGVKSFCIECGVLAEDNSKMLNLPGRIIVRQSIQGQKDDEALFREVTPKLKFDMSLFYDEWVRVNKDKLQSALKDSNQVETLHELLTNFLTQGLKTSHTMQARIIEEIEAGRRSGNG